MFIKVLNKAALSFLLCFSLAAYHATAADIFIYQLPDGSRLISDKALDNKDYKLVSSYVADDYFGTADRPFKSSYNTRSSQYDALIKKTAEANNIDPKLVKAIVQVESSFQANALSPKGAAGLMQLMPATAARFGVTDRYDPQQSLQGGSEYLALLLELFDDDRLAIAAYNAGENAVQKYNGIPPYKETEQYVEKVTNLWQKYKAE